MLNMIDIGERAGSGIPNIYRVWHDQNWAEPTFYAVLYSEIIVEVKAKITAEKAEKQ